MKADCDSIFWKPFVPRICCSNFLRSWEVFVIPAHSYFSSLVKCMSCDSLQWTFVTWGVFFVTRANILSNMLILIFVMETTRTNHKNFQVVLHWHSYMPQQYDNHLRMIIMLQWHIAVSCDHVIAWEYIITISIKNIYLTSNN